MNDISFCCNCGQKITIDSNFCPKCGTRVAVVEEDNKVVGTKDIIENKKDKQSYPQFKTKIENQVVQAYVSGTKIIKNGLYTKGLNYGYTQDQIDEIILQYEERVEKYIEYLGKLYCNGSLLMLDVTDEIKHECSEYGSECLGLNYKDCGEIYEKYVIDNKLSAKYGLLLTVILRYGKTGYLDDNLIKEEDPETKEFKNKEYIRLKKAIEQLLTLQDSLYKGADTIELKEQDLVALNEKGMELGFNNKDCIQTIINGNERKLGYHDKILEKHRNDLKRKNQNKIIISVKKLKVSLLGKNVEFGTPYFVEEYTMNFYKPRIKELKDATILKIKSLCKSDEDKSLGLSAYIDASFVLWGEIVEQYFQFIGMDKEFCDVMNNYFSQIFKAFGEDLSEVGELYEAIDDNVDEARLKGELRKAFRGKWSIGGIGFKGIIKGAVVGEILNAGSGLVYDAINGVTIAATKKNAKEAKDKLTGVVIPVISKFFEMVGKNTPIACMVAMYQKYPYCVWMNSEKYENKLNSKYCEMAKLEDSTEEKNRIAIELLLENPYKVKYYKYIFESIKELKSKEQQKKDIEALFRVADRFNLSNGLYEEIFNDIAQKATKEDVDIMLCDELLNTENLLGRKREFIQNKIYGAYLSNIVKDRKEKYDVKEINDILKILADFKEKYEYPVTDFYVENFKERVFFNIGLIWKP